MESPCGKDRAPQPTKERRFYISFLSLGIRYP
jgi:hypothetical protein